MLGVVNHFASLRLDERGGLADEPQVFVERRLQHVGHVQRPRFANQRHDRRRGIHHRAQVRIVRRRSVGAARHTERGKLGGFEFHGFGALEKFHIFGIRARPATFDVRHAEFIEQARDAEFIIDRQRNAFPLRTVAEGRVVD